MQKAHVIRMAMPVSIPSHIKQKMRGTGNEGWAVDPEAERTPPELGVRKLEEVAPGMDLTLPKIFRYKPSDIRTINGKQCLVVYTEEPKNYKKVTKAVAQYVQDKLTPLPNGEQHYPGLVRAINLETGEPEEFPYDEVIAQIKAPSEAIGEETRKKVNAEIQAYNKRIDEIDAATANLSRLPLQIARAEKMVRDRITVLDAMIAATSVKHDQAKAQKPQGIGEMEGHVDQAIKGGGLGEKDFIDHVAHAYAYRYNDLVKDLQSGALAVPAGIPDAANLKLRLMNMGQAAFDAYTAAKAKRLEQKPPAAPFDIEKQDVVGNLQELQPGDVPASYKVPGFHNLQGYLGSLWGTIKGCEKDRDKLLPIADGMAEIAQLIGSLPPGQRSQEYVTGPEGQELLHKLAELSNQRLRPFTESYSKDIVDPSGRINTRHFGTSGSMGNAMLLVVFTRLFKIISTFLKNSGYQKPTEEAGQLADTVMEQVPVQAPVQASNKEDRMKVKISRTFWESIGKQGGWMDDKGIVQTAKWGKKDVVNPAKKGMWDGYSQDELKSKLEAAKKRQEGRDKADPKDSTLIKELQFALRAKHNWGDVK